MKTMERSTESKLKAAIGEYVRLVNTADVEGTPFKLRIKVHGELIEPDESGEWVVRVKDCGHGVSVVGFTPSHVEDIFRQPSGITEITLR